MNWFQILTLVIQELPAIETAALDTVQFITAIVHTASASGNPAIGTAALALKPKAKNPTPAPAPVAPPPVPAAPPAPTTPATPTMTPFGR